MPLSKPDAEWAWACGLFEGEGTVINRGYGRHRSRGLSLSSTDRDVLDRFAEVIGHGAIGAQRNRPGLKPIWRWSLTRWCHVEPTARAMLPWLGARRSEAVKELLRMPPIYSANTRLSDEQVEEIRARAGEGETHSALAEEFAISQPYCTRIINRERRAERPTWRAELSR